MGKQRLSRKKRKIYGPANQEDRINRPVWSSGLEGLRNLEASPTVDHRNDPLSTQERRVSELAPGRHPALQIARVFNASAPEAKPWQRFFNHVESRNTTAGKILRARDIACVIISAKAMDRMFEHKFPTAYPDRHKARQLQRQFADEFSEFVRSESQRRINVTFDQQTAPRLHTGGMFAIGDQLYVPGLNVVAGGVAVEDELELEEEVSPYLGPGEFTVNDIGLSRSEGGTPPTQIERLHLDLGRNGQLYEDFEAIRGFLQQSGFTTDFIREPHSSEPVFAPRADFFELSQQAGRIGISYMVDRPAVLPLYQPTAFNPYK